MTDSEELLVIGLSAADEAARRSRPKLIINSCNQHRLRSELGQANLKGCSHTSLACMPGLMICCQCCNLPLPLGRQLRSSTLRWHVGRGRPRGWHGRPARAPHPQQPADHDNSSACSAARSQRLPRCAARRREGRGAEGHGGAADRGHQSDCHRPLCLLNPPLHPQKARSGASLFAARRRPPHRPPWTHLCKGMRDVHGAEGHDTRHRSCRGCARRSQRCRHRCTAHRGAAHTA